MGRSVRKDLQDLRRIFAEAMPMEGIVFSEEGLEEMKALLDRADKLLEVCIVPGDIVVTTLDIRDGETGQVWFSAGTPGVVKDVLRPGNGGVYALEVEFHADPGVWWHLRPTQVCVVDHLDG